MRVRFLRLVLSAVILGCSAVNLRADGVPATVDEGLYPSDPRYTQYTVNNASDSPFDIALFVSTTTGINPSTTNTNWIVESLSATAWTEPMGYPAVSELYPKVSWQTYTGMTWDQAFPNSPFRPPNGYFLNYGYSSQTGDLTYPGSPIIPGSSLAGFFFVGAPSSTFLVAGPLTSDQTPLLADVQTFSGTSVDIVPEPASLAVLALTLGGLGLVRRRRQPA